MMSAKQPQKSIQKIKFEIFPKEISVPDILEEIRWENDGGNIPISAGIIDESSLPLRPGTVFKVLNGSLLEEDDRVFYLAEIQLVEP